MHRLKELRGDKTQEYVAKKIGISRQSFRNYEAGTREPDLNTLKLIADYFDVTVDYLLGRTDSPNLALPEEANGMGIAFYNGISTEGLDADQVKDVQTFIEYLKSKKKI